MKLLVIILACVTFILSAMWFGVNLKKYLDIYNNFVDGRKLRKAYGTDDTLLLKPHLKKAIIYSSICYGIALPIFLVYVIADIFNYYNNDNILIELIPVIYCLLLLISNYKIFLVAKSHTHIMLGSRIFKISDIKSVDYESEKSYNRFIFTMKSGKTKRITTHFNKSAYDFILKTIEENAGAVNHKDLSLERKSEI